VRFFPLTSADKDALIGTLLAPVEVLMAENAEPARWRTPNQALSAAENSGQFQYSAEP
jgi:hypothetical protein